MTINKAIRFTQCCLYFIQNVLTIIYKLSAIRQPALSLIACELQAVTYLKSPVYRVKHMNDIDYASTPIMYKS